MVLFTTFFFGRFLAIVVLALFFSCHISSVVLPRFNERRKEKSREENRSFRTYWDERGGGKKRLFLLFPFLFRTY